MSEQEPTGTLIIPTGEKLYYKSELFDVVVRHKSIDRRWTRDRYLVAVELIENDPLLQRTALLEIPDDVWSQLSIGERAKVRLYEQPDQSWSSLPPAEVR